MRKTIYIIASISAGLAVALGAFGAHGLQSLTSDPKIIHGYETAVEYQFYHSLALFITGLLSDKFNVSWLRWAKRCFIAGIILFSGSLYLLTFLKLHEDGFTRYVGPVTPLGGLLFILGWMMIAIAVWSEKR